MKLLNKSYYWSNNILVNYCNITQFRNPAMTFFQAMLKVRKQVAKSFSIVTNLPIPCLQHTSSWPFDLVHDTLLPWRIWGQML